MAKFETKEKPGRRRKGHKMAECTICGKVLTKRGLYGHLQQGHKIEDGEERRRLVALGEHAAKTDGADEGETAPVSAVAFGESTVNTADIATTPEVDEPAPRTSWRDKIVGVLYDE